jgi:4-aminobutyrate aminotransferase
MGPRKCQVIFARALRADLAERIEDSSQPNTFAGNAVAAVTCMTNIDILTENDQAVIGRVAQVGAEILDRLAELAKDSPWVGDVRGRGFMIGIELVKDKQTKDPFDADRMGKVIIGMLNRGVIMVPCGRYGNVLRFMPPLTITREYVQKAIDILFEVLEET